MMNLKMVTFSKTDQQFNLVEKICDFLKSFPGRVVSMGIWPARSPDLIPLDFSISDFLKTEVFKERINNLQELVAPHF
jgi:hypothetical protein